MKNTRVYRFGGNGYFARGEFTYRCGSKLGSKANYEAFASAYRHRFGRSLTWDQYVKLVRREIHSDFIVRTHD